MSHLINNGLIERNRKDKYFIVHFLNTFKPIKNNKMNFFQKSINRTPKTWLVIGFLISLCSPLIYFINGHSGQTGFVLGIGVGLMYVAIHRMYSWKI